MKVIVPLMVRAVDDDKVIRVPRGSYLIETVTLPVPVTLPAKAKLLPLLLLEPDRQVRILQGSLTPPKTGFQLVALMTFVAEAPPPTLIGLVKVGKAAVPLKVSTAVLPAVLPS